MSAANRQEKREAGAEHSLQELHSQGSQGDTLALTSGLQVRRNDEAERLRYPDEAVDRTAVEAHQEGKADD